MAVDTSAKSIITDFLRQFGLESLANWAWSTYISAGGGDLGTQTVTAQLPDQALFKLRFPAYDVLAKKGHAMTPAEMVAYEKAATGIMRSAGIPAGFYDQPADFAKLLSNEVSVAELQQRVQLAQGAAYESSPEVRQELKAFYGIGEGDITAHFLDPTVAEPLLQQKFVSAQVGGASLQAGFGVTQSAAERLALSGMTADQARQTFGELGAQKGLFGSTLGEQAQGQANISADEAALAAQGLDPASKRRIAKRTQSRQAGFQGTGGYQISQGGAAGLRQPLVP